MDDLPGLLTSTGPVRTCSQTQPHPQPAPPLPHYHPVKNDSSLLEDNFAQKVRTAGLCSIGSVVAAADGYGYAAVGRQRSGIDRILGTKRGQIYFLEGYCVACYLAKPASPPQIPPQQ